MLLLFAILGFLLVLLIAFVSVAFTVRNLSEVSFPSVLEVDDAVEWISERLPEEAASQLRKDEVFEIIGWWLDSIDSAGLTSEHGQEIGEGRAKGKDESVADLDVAVDEVVARALETAEPLNELAVVVVLDLLVVYLTEIGAISGQPAEQG
ncbi:MAG: hypothetical protein QGF06_03720 [Acidimicrobiales bacterium]|nr:hypothetical protein [Acidimicrobiales bacterium]MDP6894821.1 hypothetical protein [Acidimicrobiales bacterium]HJM37906.1 hypothetical protein [Acidimicrobiales bacterium]